MSRFWDHHSTTIDLNRFRATDQFLDQPDEYPWVTVCQALERDEGIHRIKAMGEDGSYGARVWDYKGLPVSRDLLDALLEIKFLEICLPRFGIRSCIDIGAGYGRLAWRMQQAHPDLEFTCADVVNASLEACFRYRAHRRGKWMIRESVGRHYDLAINTHSWSECTRDEVFAWVQSLSTQGVPWLFVKPHGPDFSTRDAYDAGLHQRDGKCPEGEEFRTVIEAHGYHCQAYETAFHAHHYLFRLGS